MRSALQGTLRVYKFSFPAWTLVGLFFFTQGLVQKLAIHDPSPWWHHFVSWLIGAYICAAFTPLIFWLGRQFPIERPRRVRRFLLHALFSITFSVAEIAIHSTSIQVLGLFPTLMRGFAGAAVTLMIIAFHQNIMTYWTLLGIGYVLRYYQQEQERKQQTLRLELQASELKGQLAEAQLSALNTQLQPHFLFNTLNAIMVLVRQAKSKEAEDMLARLSDLLRCVLEDVGVQEVSLRRELEYVQLYLSIQQVRYQDRLRVQIKADPVLMEAVVPHLCLQPLVENAIQHGIAQISSAGELEVVATRTGDRLTITVSDDGPGLTAGAPPGLGIGLRNTRARLAQLYGAEASLELQNRSSRGAIATVVLPYRLSESDHEAEMVEWHAVHSADC